MKILSVLFVLGTTLTLPSLSPAAVTNPIRAVITPRAEGTRPSDRIDISVLSPTGTDTLYIEAQFDSAVVLMEDGARYGHFEIKPEGRLFLFVQPVGSEGRDAGWGQENDVFEAGMVSPEGMVTLSPEIHFEVQKNPVYRGWRWNLSRRRSELVISKQPAAFSHRDSLLYTFENIDLDIHQAIMVEAVDSPKRAELLEKLQTRLMRQMRLRIPQLMKLDFNPLELWNKYKFSHEGAYETLKALKQYGLSPEHEVNTALRRLQSAQAEQIALAKEPLSDLHWLTHEAVHTPSETVARSDETAEILQFLEGTNHPDALKVMREFKARLQNDSPFTRWIEFTRLTSSGVDALSKRCEQPPAPIAAP